MATNIPPPAAGSAERRVTAPISVPPRVENIPATPRRRRTVDDRLSRSTISATAVGQDSGRGLEANLPDSAKKATRRPVPPLPPPSPEKEAGSNTSNQTDRGENDAQVLYDPEVARVVVKPMLDQYKRGQYLDRYSGPFKELKGELAALDPEKVPVAVEYLLQIVANNSRPDIRTIAASILDNGVPWDKVPPQSFEQAYLDAVKKVGEPEEPQPNNAQSLLTIAREHAAHFPKNREEVGKKLEDAWRPFVEKLAGMPVVKNIKQYVFDMKFSGLPEELGRLDDLTPEDGKNTYLAAIRDLDAEDHNMRQELLVFGHESASSFPKGKGPAVEIADAWAPHVEKLQQAGDPGWRNILLEVFDMQQQIIPKTYEQPERRATESRVLQIMQPGMTPHELHKALGENGLTVELRDIYDAMASFRTHHIPVNLGSSRLVGNDSQNLNAEIQELSGQGMSIRDIHTQLKERGHDVSLGTVDHRARKLGVETKGKAEELAAVAKRRGSLQAIANPDRTFADYAKLLREDGFEGVTPQTVRNDVGLLEKSGVSIPVKKKDPPPPKRQQVYPNPDE